MTKRIDPPLKTWGGKHYLAKTIIALLPPHTVYCEPFFGGGSVLLAKDPEGVSEIVNDLDSELTNFWECLRDGIAFGLMRRQLEAMPFSEKDWREAGNPDLAEGYWARSPKAPVDRAIAFFVRCRMSMAGRGESFAPLTRRRTRRGMNEQASAWLSAIDGLPAVHERLKRVVILNRPAIEVLQSQDGPDTCFYVDPPYVPSTRTNPDVYRHEMTAEDHVELLSVLKACKGKVVLSGYWSELYDLALPTWNRRDVVVPNHGAGGKKKRAMTECLWTNF